MDGATVVQAVLTVATVLGAYLFGRRQWRLGVVRDGYAKLLTAHGAWLEAAEQHLTLLERLVRRLEPASTTGSYVRDDLSAFDDLRPTQEAAEQAYRSYMRAYAELRLVAAGRHEAVVAALNMSPPARVDALTTFERGDPYVTAFGERNSQRLLVENHRLRAERFVDTARLALGFDRRPLRFRLARAANRADARFANRLSPANRRQYFRLTARLRSGEDVIYPWP